MKPSELIHDWNAADPFDWTTAKVDLNDETLRDGLQSPSAIDPPIDTKIKLLHLMVEIGVDAADIGLPGAGPHVVDAVRALAKEIADAKLPIFPNCAARTVVVDVEPVARISQEVGIPVEVCTFIGSSPIRQFAEGWTLDRMLETSEKAVRFAVTEGIPVMFVTEDTTRAKPETVKALYENAINWGARRICLCDTVGHATPAGVKSLVRFAIEEIVEPSGEDVKVDFHGHRDRGLGLINCMAAIEAGVDRVHATGLGLGERVGNAEMDQLIVNLYLLGTRKDPLPKLREYCTLVAEACGASLPPNYPVMGEDAFRTGTGVHASAVVKARDKGDDWLADRVYSGVPAGSFGARQVIEISPMSGLSNVKFWLSEHGYDAADEALSERLFAAAKGGDRTLTEEECHSIIAETKGNPLGGNA